MDSNHFIININSIDLPNARTNRILSNTDRNANRYIWHNTRYNYYFTEFFFKPKLSIEYNSLPDVNIEQNSLIFGNTIRTLKIIVKNSGKSIAENCEAIKI